MWNEQLFFSANQIINLLHINAPDIICTCVKLNFLQNYIYRKRTLDKVAIINTVAFCFAYLL